MVTKIDIFCKYIMMTKSSCHQCHLNINDKLALQVGNTIWHSNCLRCYVCGDNLQERCYVRKNMYYCRKDFHSLFGPKCHGCHNLIGVSDLVRQIHSRFYHSDCLVCDVCKKTITTGEQMFIVDQNRFLCKNHFETYAANNDEDNKDNADYEADLEFPENDNDALSAQSNTLQTSFQTPITLNPLSSNNAPSIILSPCIKSEPETKCDVMNYVTSPTQKHSSLTEGCNSSGNLSYRSRSVSTTSVDSRINEMDSDGALSDKSDDISITHSKQYDDDVNLSLPIIADGKDFGDDDDSSNNGIKRRGPRTTIKAKQLEILKSAFQSSPKPARHTRELLARETGLNMRVIQVWFQNRRSKERRMKQINALNLRRRQVSHGTPMFGYGRNGTNDHVVPDWTPSIINDYTAKDIEYRDTIQLRNPTTQQQTSFSSHSVYNTNNNEAFAYPITQRPILFSRQPTSYDSCNNSNNNNNNIFYPEINSW